MAKKERLCVPKRKHILSIIQIMGGLFFDDFDGFNRTVGIGDADYVNAVAEKCGGEVVGIEGFSHFGSLHRIDGD